MSEGMYMAEAGTPKPLDDLRIIYFTPGKILPYHLIKFARLAEIYPNLTFVNLVLNDPRPGHYDLGPVASRTLVIGDTPAARRGWGRFKAVLETVKRYQPQVMIIPGYYHLSLVAAARWAGGKGIARIMQGGIGYGDRPRYRLKEWLKKWLIVKPHFDAAFVPGIFGLQYVQSLGIPGEFIWRGMNTVDNDYFAQGAAEVRKQAESWRARLKLPADYFLSVARLTPVKNLERLLQAYHRYREQGGAWSLVLVGAGPQEQALRAQAARQGDDGIHFAGWGSYEDLPVFYGLANCFVLPSLSEAWGLVVHEAMACGLPILLSRKCGCYPELCHRGINGFDFDPLNVEGLTRLMLKISNGSLDLKAMGEASRRLVSHYTLDTWLLALRDCIDSTVKRINSGL
jgi:1,2-diacylglycerol 3-alpha-glucosyltransferase